MDFARLDPGGKQRGEACRAQRELVRVFRVEREKEGPGEPVQGQTRVSPFCRLTSRRQTPPLKPSIGSNFDLYAIFGLSRIQ